MCSNDLGFCLLMQTVRSSFHTFCLFELEFICESALWKLLLDNEPVLVVPSYSTTTFLLSISLKIKPPV